MKKLIAAFTLSALLLTTASCNTKESPTEEISNQVSEASSSEESSSMSEEEKINITPKYFDMTDEEYQKIYDSVPYEKFDQSAKGLEDMISFLDITKIDDRAGRMRGFLYNLFHLNVPDGFSSTADITSDFALHAAINNTSRCDFVNDSDYDENSGINDSHYVEEMSFLSEIDLDDAYMESHLNQTNVLLFGEELELNKDGEKSSYPYYPNLKLFGINEFDIFNIYYPEIIDYIVTDEGLEVEFILLKFGSDGFLDEEDNPIDDENLIQFMSKTATRYKSLLVETEDGFIIKSFVKA